ncbi:MAG: AAA family ATPase [Fimbriimonadales bacterium]|nr:AAA family ATPase [Fimbriimonadales bacterium]
MAADQPTALELLEEILEMIPPEMARVRNHLSALRRTLRAEERQNDELREQLAQFQEAYEKLTSPANRIAVFLRWLEDDRCLIAVGDTEYVAQVDPNVDKASLETGARIAVNEAFAVLRALEASGLGVVAKVAEVLENGRIRLGGDTPGSASRILLRGHQLADRSIAPGDEVLVEPNGKVAVDHYPQREARDYFFEEVPEIHWEQVGGQEEAIRLIRETIEHPLLHPEIYRRFDKKPIKGILLYGPPGCGKTLIGKATAYNLTREYAQRVGHDVKEYFMYISGPKILNMWLGETERMVREIFRTAREKAQEGRLVFIFMDEAESVLRTRSSGRWLNISNTVVPQFCAELDGLVSLENVVLILTSNRPDYIDPAVLRPERIDRKVKVARPNRESSRQILGIYLHERVPLDPAELKRLGTTDPACARERILDEITDYLWRSTKDSEFLRVILKSGATETLYRKDLVSGALLKSVVDRAKDLAIRRAIGEPDLDHGVSLEDLKAAVDAEYRENEIFPKSDTQEDWLKLLDYEPDNVAAVRPVATGREPAAARNTVI